MSEQRIFFSAVQRFLVTMANHANFLTMRDEQYENCRLKIQQWPSMPMETITEVVGLVADLPVTPDQLSQLQLDVSQKMQAVQPLSQSAAKGGRRPQQNYQHFCSYLTNSLWLLVLGDNPLVNALVPIARHLGKLGLRLPSEKTCSKVTALLLYRVADRMDQHALHRVFEHVKGIIKRELAAFSLSVQPFIVELSHDPSELHRPFFDEAFKDEPVTQIQVDVARLTHIHSNIRERMPPSSLVPMIDYSHGAGGSGMSQELQQMLARLQDVRQPALPNLQINMDALQRRGSFRAPPGQSVQPPPGQLALMNEPANAYEPDVWATPAAAPHRAAAPTQENGPTQCAVPTLQNPDLQTHAPQPTQLAMQTQGALQPQAPQQTQLAMQTQGALQPQAPQPTQLAAQTQGALQTQAPETPAALQTKAPQTQVALPTLAPDEPPSGPKQNQEKKVGSKDRSKMRTPRNIKQEHEDVFDLIFESIHVMRFHFPGIINVYKYLVFV